ncbi:MULTISPECIES: glycine betaine/L-proline ABC transporter ATP-binding protein ProV [unclassified Wenzhouxiangella]|uniref:glycine betaine/L-proline ABC transporter ATP-binding protein ProV n=1 Tax=unclassified Wenzhouxiangella TaxID=2613841 RepID=UPI000E3292F7|nr:MULTISPECIES: glycine betaine/L-proline ABC transporter ATP-binding protein ProV [unclassified Wenzhouxiangella]RFF28810.1 proline/glycine betaine ABC transporter ATP-binding protein ProV [Wenzhouxiangella sp. 15181]RFP68213.1 proline/glycine betaine ABC transporter ATP-binding protein ProV [Wenzhouxiangella sp. 15190]
MSDAPMIEVSGLYKIFGANPDAAMPLIEKGLGKDEIFEQTGQTIGVHDAELSIREGEIFVVMGLSGSGKSTMVRLLNRLIEPTSGRISIDGRDVTAMSQKELIELRRHDLAMVFQSFALMPHRTVLDNAAFGLEVAGEDRDKRRERGLKALDQVGLKANANSYPDELSGGMQQRVGLARALATDPSIMLMDEAFSALDPLIRTEMQDELLELQRQQARTVVFISHDLDEAMRIGDRIAIMQDGKIVQVGTPEEIVTQPANDYVRSFFYGVDISQVFTASDIMDKQHLTVVKRPGMGVRAALESLRRHDRDFAVVVGSDGRYEGMVSADALARVLNASDEPNFPDAFESVEPVDTDSLLDELIGRCADTSAPIPVVDSDGRYRGAVSRSRLLRTLDRTGEESNE